MLTVISFFFKYFLAGFLFLAILGYINRKHLRLTRMTAVASVFLSIAISLLTGVGEAYALFGEHLFLSSLLTLSVSALLASGVGYVQYLIGCVHRKKQIEVRARQRRSQIVMLRSMNAVERAS